MSPGGTLQLRCFYAGQTCGHKVAQTIALELLSANLSLHVGDLRQPGSMVFKTRQVWRPQAAAQGLFSGSGLRIFSEPLETLAAVGFTKTRALFPGRGAIAARRRPVLRLLLVG